MINNPFYFRHDYSARNDDKILELRAKYGAEGYGIFWMILESMAENEDGGLKATLIGGLSIGFGIPKEKLNEIIEFLKSIELLYKKDNKYFSKRMLEHKEYRKFLSEKGKEGVRIREEKKHGMKGGISYPSSKEGNRIEGKEIKGVDFVEEKTAVKLSDGSIQKLGKGQMFRITQDDLKPEQVFKGLIL